VTPVDADETHPIRSFDLVKTPYINLLARVSSPLSSPFLKFLSWTKERDRFNEGIIKRPFQYRAIRRWLFVVGFV